MRFPTSRKSTQSGRVAGLLALSSVLFSTVSADPCQTIYNELKGKAQGTNFPSKLAYDCLKALPLNEEYAKQTADALLPIHELVSYQTYFKKPPTPELEIPPHDGAAEIKKIQENLKKGHYKGLYDFSTDVYKVFMNYRDGHTQVNPLINYLFNYAHPYSIVSVADSPTSKPKVWTLNEDRKLNKEVAKIDGKPVAEYLSALANSTLQNFGFTDPDTRYNMLFAQFPTVAPEETHEHMGFFQYVRHYPGADKFTFTFADGSEQEVEWLARVASDEYLPFFKGGAKEVASLGWVPDADWDEMTRQWTEEEAINFAIQAGWEIANITSPNQETKSKKGHKPPHVAHHGHKPAKHHPDFAFTGKYHSNGEPRGKPHKRDVVAMKKLLRKLKRRTEVDDDIEDDDYDVEDDDYVEDDYVEDDYVEDDDYDDYDEEETATHTPTPTHTPTHTQTPTHTPTPTSDTTYTDDDDDTYTDLPTLDTSGQDPGFPEYFNTTRSGNFRFYSLDGETAVLDVSSFGVESSQDIIEASDLLDYGLDYVSSTGHKYLIIDLTNNGGGAAFLPFDFTRMLFPQKYKFESVNMRYTKAGYLMLKNKPLAMYWTVEEKDWNSLEDLYTPVKRDGDEFTQMFKYDHLEITAAGGYGEDRTQKQYFSKDNIVVLSNGYCGSACFAWYESLDRQGVRSYAMGGRPNGSKYMQTSGGVKGGVLFSIEEFTILKLFYSAFDDEEARKIAKVLPGPIRLNLRYNGLNVENQFRNGEEDQLPLEFRYNPACKRYSWTKDMMVDTGYTWKFIREHAWDKHGKPTGCEKAYVPEKPYKHETTTDTKKYSKHADNRVPEHAPPKKKGHKQPKYGSKKPKYHAHAKEHKVPYADYPPESGVHHKKGTAHKQPHKPKASG